MEGISPQRNPPEGAEKRSGSATKREGRAAMLMATQPDFHAPKRLPLPLIFVQTLEEALTVVSQQGQEIRCAIVQESFGEGRGVDLIAEVRALLPLLPILLNAPAPNRNVLGMSYAYDLEFVTGQCSDEIVERFVRSSMSRPRATYEQLEKRLTHMAERHSLTSGELRIVTAVTRGMTRSELIAAFDVSVNTLKSQTRSILKKTGHASLGELSRVALTSLFTAPV